MRPQLRFPNPTRKKGKEIFFFYGDTSGKKRTGDLQDSYYSVYIIYTCILVSVRRRTHPFKTRSFLFRHLSPSRSTLRGATLSVF